MLVKGNFEVFGAERAEMRAIFPQNVESDLKRTFFKDCEHGYFVEVGANQPRDGSQTFELEQRGWEGVLIEPQPDLAADLGRQRSAKVFNEACSSRQNSGSKLTLHLAGGHSSFDPKLNLPEVKPHGSIEVPARTLNEILIEAGASRIDFISIDVEGHELDVLDGFDLKRWNPRLILIEDFLLNLRPHRLLKRGGYRWLCRTGINNWYVPADKAPSIGLDGGWQFFNKFYLGTPFRRLRTAWRRLRTVPHFVDSECLTVR
jgi:FkbM family methyltransferase